MAVGDPARLLGHGLGRELVGRHVLPLPGLVDGVADLQGLGDLALTAGSEADQQQFLDARGPGASLARTALPGAHHAPLDDRCQVSLAGRAALEHGQPAVPIRAQCAHQLVVGEAQALAVEVGARPQAEEDHAAGADPAGGVERQDFVDAPAVLAGVEGLADEPAQRLVEVARAGGQGLACDHRDGDRVDLQLGRRKLRQ